MVLRIINVLYNENLNVILLKQMMQAYYIFLFAVYM